MESKLKQECMESVGELPDFRNLLLRESGYPHLEDTPKQSQSDAWNDASVLPTECKVYETKVGESFITAFQFFDGEKWSFACGNKDYAEKYKRWEETSLPTKQWREVQL